MQFFSYKREDIQNSKARKPKREWDIPKTRWQSLGFRPQMNLLQARSRAKQLNAQVHLQKHEVQLKKIAEGQAQNRRRYDSVLPSELVAEFESREKAQTQVFLSHLSEIRTDKMINATENQLNCWRQSN